MISIYYYTRWSPAGRYRLWPPDPIFRALCYSVCHRNHCRCRRRRRRHWSPFIVELVLFIDGNLNIIGYCQYTIHRRGERERERRAHKKFRRRSHRSCKAYVNLSFAIFHFIVLYLIARPPSPLHLHLLYYCTTSFDHFFLLLIIYIYESKFVSAFLLWYSKYFWKK